MTLLVLVLLALAGAPLLERLLRARPGLEVGLDAALQVAIVGIVLLHVLPEAVEEGGPVAGLGLLLGLALGQSLHMHPQAGPGISGLAAAALVLHALVDGAALGGEEAQELGLAVFMHTLPVALLCWRLGLQAARPRLGGALLAGMAAATLLGFAASRSAAQLAPPQWMGAAQGLIGGVLLHVAAHLHPPRGAVLAGAGGVAGLAIALAVGLASGHAPLAPALLDVARSSAPGLLASLLVMVLSGWRGLPSRLRPLLRPLGTGPLLSLSLLGPLPALFHLMAEPRLVEVERLSPGEALQRASEEWLPGALMAMAVAAVLRDPQPGLLAQVHPAGQVLLVAGASLWTGGGRGLVILVPTLMSLGLVPSAALMLLVGPSQTWRGRLLPLAMAAGLGLLWQPQPGSAAERGLAPLELPSLLILGGLGLLHLLRAGPEPWLRPLIQVEPATRRAAG